MQCPLHDNGSSVFHPSCFSTAWKKHTDQLNSRRLTRSAANALGGLVEQVPKKPRKNPVDDLLEHAGVDAEIGAGSSSGYNTRCSRVPELHNDPTGPRDDHSAAPAAAADIDTVMDEEDSPTEAGDTPPLVPADPTAPLSDLTAQQHEEEVDAEEDREAPELFPNITYESKRDQWRGDYTFRGRRCHAGRHATPLLVARELAADYKDIISILEERVAAGSRASILFAKELEMWSSLLTSIERYMESLGDENSGQGPSLQQQQRRKKRSVLEAHLAATELDEVYTLLQDLEVSAELFNAADEKLKQAGFRGTLYGLLKILAEGACESFFYDALMIVEQLI